MAIIIQTVNGFQLYLDGELVLYEKLDAEVLKRKVLEPDAEIYFEYNRFYYDKVKEKYFSKLKIRLDNCNSGNLCYLGYEGDIEKEYEEDEYFAQWSTISVVNPTIYDAYKCFVNAICSRLSSQSN
jgi:hypothetical protein